MRSTGLASAWILMAGCALTQGGEDIREIEDLVRRVRSEDIEVREDACHRLKRWGREVLPLLVGSVADPDSEIACRAREIVGFILRRDPEAIAAWVQRGPLETNLLLDRLIQIQKHLRDAGIYHRARMWDEAIADLERASVKTLEFSSDTGIAPWSVCEIRQAIRQSEELRLFEERRLQALKSNGGGP